jgi:hypothetical protein
MGMDISLLYLFIYLCWSFTSGESFLGATIPTILKRESRQDKQPHQFKSTPDI